MLHKVNRGARIASVWCHSVVSKLMIIVSWRRPDWGKSYVLQRYWKSERHWATWFRYSAYLWSSYQRVNSSTLQSFSKAVLMLNTARTSAYVLREVFVGSISTCSLLPAHSIDCNPHDSCCMTYMARCSGLTLTLTFVELKKNIQWEASCTLRRRTLLRECIFWHVYVLGLGYFFVWPWSPHRHRTFRDVTQWTKNKSYQVWRI
jgi:hypothetical protein